FRPHILGDEVRVSRSHQLIPLYAGKTHERTPERLYVRRHPPLVYVTCYAKFPKAWPVHFSSLNRSAAPHHRKVHRKCHLCVSDYPQVTVGNPPVSLRLRHPSLIPP